MSIYSGTISAAETPQDILESVGNEYVDTPDYTVHLHNDDESNYVYLTGTSGHDTADPTYIGLTMYRIAPGDERSFDVSVGDHLWVATGTGLSQGANVRFILFTN